MALKDKWKNTGVSIGHAFKNFGKAVGTTAKVAVGKEENKVGEDVKTTLLNLENRLVNISQSNKLLYLNRLYSKQAIDLYSVGKEENKVGEDGKTTLRSSWTKVGHGFGDAGKSIGDSASGTAKKVVGKEEKEKAPSKPEESEVTDVEAKDKK